MQIKNHSLYELYLCYLDSKKLSKGARALSEISESLFYDFLKKYEFNPGFREKWEKKLLSNKRDESIGVILEKEKDCLDDFEMLFDDANITTSRDSINIDDDIFDF